MTTRLFADLIPRINASVPGCPQRTMLDEIRRSAIRACERTLYWRHVESNVAVYPGVHSYVYTKPDNTDVHAVFEAALNGRPIRRLSLEQAIVVYPEWADLYSGEDPSVLWSLTPPSGFNEDTFNSKEINSGSEFVLPASVVSKASEPCVFTQVTPDRYILLPLPDDEKSYLLRLFYALKPSRSAMGMDEYILGELEDAVVHCTLQHLLALPKVGWSDPQLATYHARQYIRELTERRARANLTNARATLTTIIPRFV